MTQTNCMLDARHHLYIRKIKIESIQTHSAEGFFHQRRLNAVAICVNVDDGKKAQCKES